MSTQRHPQGEPLSIVRPMSPEDIEGVAALAAEEPTAPHWPVLEYSRMLRVMAASPARRGAWVLAHGQGADLIPTQHPGADDRQTVGSASTLLPAAPEVLTAVPTLYPAAASAILGFCMASHVAGICDLEAVVVHRSWRGRRLGARLVEAAAAWASALSASRLQLELRRSNAAAFSLYQRLGFAVDGTRPGYYCNPQEDAILMSLTLPLAPKLERKAAPPERPAQQGPDLSQDRHHMR